MMIMLDSLKRFLERFTKIWDNFVLKIVILAAMVFLIWSKFSEKSLFFYKRGGIVTVNSILNFLQVDWTWKFILCRHNSNSVKCHFGSHIKIGVFFMPRFFLVNGHVSCFWTQGRKLCMYLRWIMQKTIQNDHLIRFCSLFKISVILAAIHP